MTHMTTSHQQDHQSHLHSLPTSFLSNPMFKDVPAVLTFSIIFVNNISLTHSLTLHSGYNVIAIRKHSLYSSSVFYFCYIPLDLTPGRVADPVFLHGSGSGFQISLDSDPVSAQILEQK